MTTHLADHFARRRLERGLRPAQLARSIGYTNIARGCRRIEMFERTGRVTPDLLTKLSLALDVEQTTINRLFRQDYQEWLRRMNVPIRPYLLRRMLFGGGPLRIPSGFKSFPAMEKYAASLAQKWQMDVCLVVSHRIGVWFAKDGSLKEVIEQVPEIGMRR